MKEDNLAELPAALSRNPFSSSLGVNFTNTTVNCIRRVSEVLSIWRYPLIWRL